MKTIFDKGELMKALIISLVMILSLMLYGAASGMPRKRPKRFHCSSLRAH